MSTYTGGVGIVLATGATILLTRLGIVRHQGTKVTRNGSNVAVPTLSVSDTLAARSGPWTSTDRRALVEASGCACDYISGKNIRIYPYQAVQKVRAKRNCVQIFLPENSYEASPSEGESTPSLFRVAPGILCGQTLDALVPALTPSRGGKVVTDSFGFPIAELVGDRVFILIQCSPAQNARLTALYRSVLSEALCQISGEVAAPSIERQSLLASRDDVEELLPTELREPSFVQLQSQIREKEEAIATLQQSEQVCLSNIFTLQLERRIAQQLLEANCDRALKLREELIALPQVEKVEFFGNHLSLLTSELSCVHPHRQTRHVLGKYRIKIYLDGSQGCVRWHNVTKSVTTAKGRINGPHIDADGRIRATDILSKFPQMIGRGQYTKVAKFAIKLASRLPDNDPEALALLELYA